MNLKQFDYDLPVELIAQHPEPNRDQSKLMIIDRLEKTITHAYFCEIGCWLSENDILVRNNTKVIPARLHAEKETTKKKIEVFLLEELECPASEIVLSKLSDGLKNKIKANYNNHKICKWKVLLRPAKKVGGEDLLIFPSAQGKFAAFRDLDDSINSKERTIYFLYEGNFSEQLENLGEIPLPPYISRKTNQDDKKRYQTVFAKNLGAVAAPTAGLHFTESLCESLQRKGVTLLDVTLHVGYGTFQPVTSENILEHKMHSEKFEIIKTVAEEINDARQKKKRIVACGTTVVRVLESLDLQDDLLKETKGETDIFIHEPFSFQLVDALITNFHLPKSTLLMLVAAFCGYDLMMRAYQEAIKNKYRFFSYGDAMLII